MSVRQAETLVKQINSKPKEANNGKREKGDIFIKDLEKQLEKRMGTKVKIAQSKKGGKVVIAYYNNDDLGRVCDLIIPKSFRRL